MNFADIVCDRVFGIQVDRFCCGEVGDCFV